MGRRVTSFAKIQSLACIVAAFLIGMGPFFSVKVYAADLLPRSLTLSTSEAAATDVTYQPTFAVATPGPIGSISFQFCQEDPLPYTLCTKPDGFSASGAQLATQDGMSGFSIFSGSTDNRIILTRPPAFEGTGATAELSFTGITNPSNEGAFFVRIATYASSDASGPDTDTGGLVLAITPPPTINAEVPPYLLFCLGERITDLDCETAAEPFTDVGELTPSTTATAQNQMVIATNAPTGYSMWVLGSTMTAGNNVIPAMEGEPAAQGVSQFGINLRANTSPLVGEDVVGPGVAAINTDYAQPNEFRFRSGDVLVSSEVPDDLRKYTVSYIVNIARDQPGGIYSATFTYITLANF